VRNDIIERVEKMQETKKSKLKIILEWSIHMILYAIVLIIISLIFPNTIYIDKSMYGFWALISVILISIINTTVKPILVWLTLPITGLTLGLFYPVINLIVLKLVGIISAGHFEIFGIFFALFVSILISILNIIVDNILSKIFREDV
jgi:putative membrane protein